MVDIGDIFKNPDEWPDSEVLSGFAHAAEATAGPVTLEMLQEQIEAIKNAPPRLDYTEQMPYYSDPMSTSFSGVPIVKYDGTNADQVVKALGMVPDDFIALFPEKPILIKGHLVNWKPKND